MLGIKLPGPWQAAKLKLSLIKVAALILFVMAFVAVMFLAEDYVNARDLKRSLARYALEMQAGLPRKLDDQTTMVAVRADGTTVTFHYRMSQSFEALGGKAYVARSKSRLRKMVCGSPAMAKDLTAGVKYRYSYKDQTGREIFEITFQDPDCSI